MRFELTTVTLARWGSTTELRSLFLVRKRHYWNPRFVCKSISAKKVNEVDKLWSKLLIWTGLQKKGFWYCILGERPGRSILEFFQRRW